MITLPARPDRAGLASFGLSLAVLLAPVTGLVCGAAWGAAAGIVLAGSAVAYPRLWDRPYTLWNRVAGRVARGAVQLVLGVSWLLIMTVVGRAGSALVLRRPPGNGSLWIARTTLSAERFPSQHDHAVRARPEAGSLAAFVSLASRPGNAWAFVLLPLLLVLRSLSSDEERQLPSTIYTLY